MKGEEIETYEIPLLRKLYGKPGMGQTVQDYYKNRDAIALTATQLKHYAGDAEKLKEIRTERATELKLVPMMKGYERQLAHLRKAKKRTEDKEKVKEIDERMKAVMDKFNTAYYQTVTRAVAE